MHEQSFIPNPLIGKSFMKAIEVNNTSLQKEFYQIEYQFRKGLKNWIHPLEKDINSIFDPQKNKYFKRGKCIHWIFKNGNESVGRVAAFIMNSSFKDEVKIGGIGFFECVDHQKTAQFILDTAQQWLKEQGANGMDGPIHFGQRHSWWGMLDIGHHLPPNYLQNYQPEYYKTLLEEYGFQEYFRQITFGRDVEEPLPEIVQWKAKRIFKEEGYSFKHVNSNKLDLYIKDFETIYNDAWKHFPGAQPFKEGEAKQELLKVKSIMDEELIWFGYYEEEPACFFIAIPEVNQLFKHIDGRLTWWNKLKLFYHIKTGSNRKILGLLFGVRPKFQRKGLEAALIYAMSDKIQIKNRKYDTMEMNWIADYNPKMLKLMQQLGCQRVKEHITYRYLFDRTQPFERAPVI